jgi:hypothetical protein
MVQIFVKHRESPVHIVVKGEWHYFFGSQARWALEDRSSTSSVIASAARKAVETDGSFRTKDPAGRAKTFKHYMSPERGEKLCLKVLKWTNKYLLFKRHFYVKCETIVPAMLQPRPHILNY